MDVLWACITVHHVHPIPIKTRRGHQIPQAWICRWLWAARNWTKVLRKSSQASYSLSHLSSPWAFLAFKRIVLGVYSCFLSHISSLFLVSRFLCRKQGYTKAIAANVCVESELSEKFVNKNWILEKLEGKSRNPGLFSGFFAGWGSCWMFLGWCTCLSVYWLKFHGAWVSPWSLLENTHCIWLFFPPLSSSDFVSTQFRA